MEESRFNRTSISFLVIGLIVGFIIGYVAINDDHEDYDDHENDVFVENTSSLIDSALDADSSVTQEVTTPTIEVRDILVSVSDQDAGNAVFVSEVNTPTEVWVAVREDRNGELWSILGARKVQAGIHQNIRVPLLRETEPGTLYHVVVYEEDGNGIFDHKADTLISKEGQFYTADFMTN